MKIETFCDIIDKELVLRYYPNQDNRWTAQLEHAEIKEGNILTSAYGNGATIPAAIKDYIEQIKGKKLVFNAYGKEDRQTFTIPYTLEI